MTLAELLFNKPYTPPPGIMVTRKHLQDGYAEPEPYQPSQSLQKRLESRTRSVTQDESKIMDYIRKHPASTRDQIAKDLHMNANRLAERLVALLDRGSVTREGRCMSRRGGPKTYFYWVAQRGGCNEQ